MGKRFNNEEEQKQLRLHARQEFDAMLYTQEIISGVIAVGESPTPGDRAILIVTSGQICCKCELVKALAKVIIQAMDETHDETTKEEK